MKKKGFELPIIKGLAFLEIATNSDGKEEKIFQSLGLQRSAIHKTKKIQMYTHQGIQVLLNGETDTYAKLFKDFHGSPICGMAFNVKNAFRAQERALKRGATRARGALTLKDGRDVPAVYGVGGSLVYFVDQKMTLEEWGMDVIKNPNEKSTNNFKEVDHVMITVPSGSTEQWKEYYQNLFGFKTEGSNHYKLGPSRYDTVVLVSPCRTFHIVLKEEQVMEQKIREYLATFKGAGIQHVALQTTDLVKDVGLLKASGMGIMQCELAYYAESKKILEDANLDIDIEAMQKSGILIQAEGNSIVLRAFTDKVIDNVYFELVQYLKGGPLHNEKELFRASEYLQSKV